HFAPTWSATCFVTQRPPGRFFFSYGSVADEPLEIRQARQPQPDAPMIKSELIEKIAAENPHLYQRDVEKIVNTILDTITTALAQGDRVELRDFGVFCGQDVTGAHW